MQCTSNAYLAFIFPVVKNVNVRKSFNLDYILDQGDRVFKLVGLQKPLAFDELLLNVNMKGAKISLTIFLEKKKYLKTSGIIVIWIRVMELFLHVLHNTVIILMGFMTPMDMWFSFSSFKQLF